MEETTFSCCDDACDIEPAWEKEPCLTDLAVQELRKIAEFVNKHAEALVGDMDETYIAEKGLKVAFTVSLKDSLSTITVAKEHLVIAKNLDEYRERKKNMYKQRAAVTYSTYKLGD